MADTYTLTLHNRSTAPRWTFAVYTVVPVSGSDRLAPVAWLTKTVDSGDSVTFEWTLDHRLVFAAQGIDTGTEWTEAASMPVAAGTHDNAARLGYQSDGHMFTLEPAEARPATPGRLYVDTDPNVPEYGPIGGPTVGLALSGGERNRPSTFAPAIVGTSGPGLSHVFDLDPTYYIDAGTTRQGTLVDFDAVTGFQKVEFGPGRFSCEWTLDASDTWVPGPPA
ncbi:hypothetical protein ACFV4I_00115 [Nocardiopsis alba]|uniref:hypothetical protein n=1 Tax=Nocardiopsis alba TaxID=53437 RepID=UPI003668C18C